VWRKRLFRGLLWLSGWASLGGCGGHETQFRLNAVYLHKEEVAAKSRLTDEQRQDMTEALAWLFGTPEEPRVPDLPDGALGELLDAANLQAAAGRVGPRWAAERRGLHRRYCASCHGVAGDGTGPLAALLSPYPRDFRRGVFKFKSTAGPGTPPTHDDLVRIVTEGNPGTAMPSFRRLPAEDRDALAQYTKYLAIRGQAERFLLALAVDEWEPGQRPVARLPTGTNPDRFPEPVEPVRKFLIRVAENWRTAATKVGAVPARPSEEDRATAISRGRELFRGPVANCVKCHGDDDQPASEAPDYDDWTKEIIDPGRPDAWRQFVAVGALRPRLAQPRTLRHGIYHGGGQPDQLYRRIRDGIAGTPMPAAAMKPADADPQDQRLSPEDVWCLVEYVLSLPGRGSE
jgi:mono/diheme cytochrome c family protein